jgi:uncharacterized protein YuzE
MKISYDKTVDALYIQFFDETPEGVVETGEGVNLDISVDNRIIGIEILHASIRTDLHTMYRYELEEQMA